MRKKWEQVERLKVAAGSAGSADIRVAVLFWSSGPNSRIEMVSDLSPILCAQTHRYTHTQTHTLREKSSSSQWWKIFRTEGPFFKWYQRFEQEKKRKLMSYSSINVIRDLFEVIYCKNGDGMYSPKPRRQRFIWRKFRNEIPVNKKTNKK